MLFKSSPRKETPLKQDRRVGIRNARPFLDPHEIASTKFFPRKISTVS